MCIYILVSLQGRVVAVLANQGSVISCPWSTDQRPSTRPISCKCYCTNAAFRLSPTLRTNDVFLRRREQCRRHPAHGFRGIESFLNRTALEPASPFLRGQ